MGGDYFKESSRSGACVMRIVKVEIFQIGVIVHLFFGLEMSWVQKIDL